jgi:hypothetical protein
MKTRFWQEPHTATWAPGSSSVMPKRLSGIVPSHQEQSTQGPSGV